MYRAHIPSNLPAPVRWRDDNFTIGDAPTINTVVRCAEDTVKVGPDFTIVIAHVHAFHGRGFMASVRYTHRTCGDIANGNVHLGTGPDAFAKAVEEGETIYAKKTK